MPLPNIQEQLGSIPSDDVINAIKFFAPKSSRWKVLVESGRIKHQLLGSNAETSIKDMCRLVEKVYLALGYNNDHKEFCRITESNKYLIIHAFLEERTDNGNPVRVKELESEFAEKEKHPELIQALKNRLNPAPAMVNNNINPALQSQSVSTANNAVNLVQHSDYDPLICPLTLLRFKDPVMAADGRSYERAALQKSFDGGLRICPVDPSKELTNPRDLPTNRIVLEMMEQTGQNEEKAPSIRLN